MTLPTLQSWPDFDENGEPMSETVIGSDITPIAIVLTSEHRDAFVRLALAAPDMLAALEELCLAPNKHRPDEYWEAARAAIAKAKGQ
jgi:hypothetical protein